MYIKLLNQHAPFLKERCYCFISNDFFPAITLNDTLELKFWDGTLIPATVSVISNNDFPATCTSPVSKLQTVKWTKDGDPKFSVAGNALNLAEVNLGHEGVYTCTATDSNGETASRSFTLHVLCEYKKNQFPVQK